MADIRILGVLVHSLKEGKPTFMSPVDGWRINLPLAYVKQHTDWTIDIRRDWIEGFDNMEAGMKHLGENYDILFSSYTRNAPAYAWLKAVSKKYGLKHVLDIDDDLYHIPQTNPAALDIYPGSEAYFVLDTIIQDADYITVSTPELADLYRNKRPNKDRDSVAVFPNYLSAEFYKHPVKNHLEEPEELKIVYFAGGSHHGDLHKTGFLKAIDIVLAKYPYVKFETVGMPVIDHDFLPDQYEYIPGSSQGMMGWDKLFSSLDADITVAPLEKHKFNQGKSHIKALEAGMMFAPMVATDYGPYAKYFIHQKDGLLATGVDSWVKNLSDLIENPFKRQRLSQANYDKVINNHLLENHYQERIDYFKKVVEG